LDAEITAAKVGLQKGTNVGSMFTGITPGSKMAQKFTMTLGIAGYYPQIFQLSRSTTSTRTATQYLATQDISHKV